MPSNLFQWEGFDKIFSPRATSTPVRTPPPSDNHLPPPTLSSFSSEDDDYSFPPRTPPDSQTSLDDVWENVRKAKERTLSASPSKVKSLEQYEPANMQPALQFKTDQIQLNKNSRLKKGKSYVKYKESPDGQTVTAVFDLPRVKKEDMHVSFQGSRLVVSWRTVRVTEREEHLDDETGGTRILRELEQKKYSRTIPLPEGTRFEEISAARDGRHLLLIYPNMRRVRASSQPLDELAP